MDNEGQLGRTPVRAMRRLTLGLLCFATLAGCKSNWTARETRILKGLHAGPCVEQAVRESEGIVSVEWADDTRRLLNFMSDCGPGTIAIFPNTGTVQIEICMEGSGLGMPKSRREQVHALLGQLCQHIAAECGFFDRDIEEPAGAGLVALRPEGDREPRS